MCEFLTIACRFTMDYIRKRVVLLRTNFGDNVAYCALFYSRPYSNSATCSILVLLKTIFGDYFTYCVLFY